MNALDSALVKLAAASNSLEHHAPTLDDVEMAKDCAKAAAKILDSAFTLMSCGIYTVADPPADTKYTDPAEHRIEMPEVAHIELDLPTEPMPDLFLAGFLEASPDERKVAFESALEDLDGRGLEVNPDDSSDWPDAPWWEAFDADASAAWQKLQFAIHHREPFAFTVPTDEEFSTWCAKFAPAAQEGTIQEEAAPEADPKAGLREFQDLLDRLEEAGVESGLRRKDWKKAHKAWWHAFDLNPLGTFSKVQALLTFPQVTSWDVPEDPDPFEAKEGAE